MPWCPRCGAEYGPGFRACEDCRELLVNKQPEQLAAGCPDEAGDPKGRLVYFSKANALTDKTDHPASGPGNNPAKEPAPATTGTNKRGIGEKLLIALLLIPILIYLSKTVYDALAGLLKSFF